MSFKKTIYIEKEMTGDEKKDFKKVYNICRQQLTAGYYPMVMDVFKSPKKTTMVLEFQKGQLAQMMKDYIANAAFVNADRMWLDKQEHNKEIAPE